MRQFFEKEAEQLSAAAAEKHHTARRRAVAMRCSAFAAMQSAFSESKAEDWVVQRFLEERKKNVFDALKRQFSAFSADFETQTTTQTTTQSSQSSQLTQSTLASQPVKPVKPRELSESEICALKAQLEALRGAELRRVLQVLAACGVERSDGKFPVEVQLQKLPVETLRRVMFEMQKMQEEDYVACAACGWN